MMICIGQQYEDNHEDKLRMKTNKCEDIANVTPWVKHFKQKNLVVALSTV